MNLRSTIKAAAGVALLSAAALPAFAQLQTIPPSGPTPNPATGNGGLVVEVWDSTTGTSMSEWLGGDLGTFGAPSATTAGTTLDYGILGGSTTFNSLFSAAEVAAGDVSFFVSALNDSAPSTPTIDMTIATLGTMTGSGIGGAASKIVSGVSIMNGATACNNVNPCTATSTGSPGYAVNYLGITSIGGSKTSGTAGGSALSFYQVVSNGGAISPQTAVQFASGANLATWTLSAAGDLVYSVPGGSAVPLPAAVWLLGSGLLGLAGIARRKTLAA